MSPGPCKLRCFGPFRFVFPPAKSRVLFSCPSQTGQGGFKPARVKLASRVEEDPLHFPGARAKFGCEIKHAQQFFWSFFEEVEAISCSARNRALPHIVDQQVCLSIPDPPARRCFPTTKNRFLSRPDLLPVWHQNVSTIPIPSSCATSVLRARMLTPHLSL